MMRDEPNPSGFEQLFRTSPFLETIGPLFYRKDGDGFVIRLPGLPKHGDARGGAHGGLLMTFLDTARGYRPAMSETPPAPLITASLTADFIGGAKVGDWIEAHVEVQKVGGRLAFANAFLMVNGERITRGSAVFARGPSQGS